MILRLKDFGCHFKLFDSKIGWDQSYPINSQRKCCKNSVSDKAWSVLYDTIFVFNTLEGQKIETNEVKYAQDLD